MEQESRESKLKSNPWKRIKGLKKDQLVIFLLFGVLLLVIAIPTEPEKQKGSAQDEEKPAVETIETLTDSTEISYERQQEQRLKEILEQVEGVGKVEVMLTLRATAEKIVEKDVPTDSHLVEETDSQGGSRVTRENSQAEETIFQEDENGNRTPYIVKQLEPLVEGVIVIAEGGGNSYVQQNILEAVQALFPVEAHKIKIMKMEGSK